MIQWRSANIKITWNADQSNMINDQLITWQNGQIIADRAAWAHVNIVKWPQLAKFKKFRTCNGVLNSGLDPDPELVLKKSWFPSPEFIQVIRWQNDELISWSVITWQQGERESRSPHWLHLVCSRMPRSLCCSRKGLDEDTRIQTHSIRCIPAICILWRARGSCDSCRKVSVSFVFVLRLLSRTFMIGSNLQNPFTCTGRKNSANKIGNRGERFWWCWLAEREGVLVTT